MIDNERAALEYVDNSFVADAECKGHPTEWWFPTQSMNVLRTPTLKLAKEICKSCSVKKECLEYGIATRSWGIWGGETLSQGIPNRRGRKQAA